MGTEQTQVNETSTGQATGEQAAPRTFTQQELDAIIRERLAQERDRAQKRFVEQYGDPDELVKAKQRLTELEAAQMTEAEKLRKELEVAQRAAQEKEQAVKAAELAALRLEVGQVKGLPPNLAKRLMGTTREELEADAELVLADLKPARPTAPKLDATAGGDDKALATGLTPEERALCDKHGIPYEKYAENKAKLQ